jgi:hypothetical protein
LLLSNLTSLSLSAMWSMYAGEYSSYARGFDATGLSNVMAIANVAVDMFLDPDPANAKSTTLTRFEVMVWYGEIGGITPIGFARGPIASHVLNSQA